jgi:dolichyl-phosphate-mannose-protein mannosyltransferase
MSTEPPLNVNSGRDNPPPTGASVGGRKLSRMKNRHHLPRVLFSIAIVAALWAAGVAVTGGFVFHAGALRISSQHPATPLIVAMLSAAASWLFASRGARGRALAIIWPSPAGHGDPFIALPTDHRLAPAMAFAIAVSVVILGIVKGAFVAGGADSYGYVSQADLWARGNLIVEQPIARDIAWLHAAEALAPLGYRPYRGPGDHPGDLVPIYSPGLPIVMAGFRKIAGPTAVFFVVPILGGVAVGATYAMGAALGGALVGLAGAALLATSPPFLVELLSATSDVPVTAWWAVALAMLAVDRRGSALVAGLAAGAAILTRPNLVLLAAIPGVWLVWRAVHANGSASRAWLFAAGALPACVAIALLNQRLNGSPLMSGYGALDTLYQWRNFPQNLAHYPRWLLDAQTPLVAAALASPLLLRRDEFGRRAAGGSIGTMWLCFVGAVFLSYLFYVPYDDWTYLRFILPAYPPLLALTCVSLIALARLTRRARIVAAAVIVGILAVHGVRYALDRSWPDTADEQRYAAVGRYVATHLPERAVLLSMQHSGSLRYYSGRLTVRYDWIDRGELDAVIADLRRLKYHPYLVLDGWEELRFRSRFEAASRSGTLAWTPVASFRSGLTDIYDLPDDGGGLPRPSALPDVIR